MRTEVAIVGAGPAGLLLSHLLAQDGIESVVVETRSREYVEARIRAGILESSSVELLDSVGLGKRLHAEGDHHRGIHLQWPGERHHLDFVDLVGRGVWVYGQTELQKDLGRARDAAGQRIVYEVADTAVHDPAGRPHVTFTVDGQPERLDAEVVVGCDGSFGPSRGVIPAAVSSTWTRTYPYSWLGVLAPAGTPSAVIAAWVAALDTALKDPETKALLEKQAMDTVGNSPEAFASFIKQDIAVWKEVAAQAKVEVQ